MGKTCDVRKRRNKNIYRDVAGNWRRKTTSWTWE